ncbi:mucin-5AC isoform X2 [Aplysia californica]|nr:mucin-5AC isoform X2 [Aplysia californica]
MSHHAGGGLPVVPPLSLSDMDSGSEEQCGTGDNNSSALCDGRRRGKDTPHYTLSGLPLAEIYRHHDVPGEKSAVSCTLPEFKSRLDLGRGGGDEEDSGLPDASGGSFKTSVSNPTSSADGDGEEEEEEEEDDSGDERAGVFDYTPQQHHHHHHQQQQRKTQHVRITPSLNPPYDEEVKVGSSTGGSSVESPRSNNSVTNGEYEMTTFSPRTSSFPGRRGEGDEDEEEEEGVGGRLNEHRLLYSRQDNKHNSVCWHYTGSADSEDKHSDNEDRDDDVDDHFLTSHRSSSTSTATTTTTSAVTPHTAFSPSARQPPLRFDERISMGLDRPQKQDVIYASYNMCRDGLAGMGVSDSNNKKKDKKKNRSKDEGDKSEVSPHLDVNGNPQAPSLENYSQMRQPPGGPKSDAASPLAIPPGSLIGHGSSGANSSGLGPDSAQQNELDRKRLRKQRRLEKQQRFTQVYSQTIKDFKGYEDLNDLVNFIEGNKKQPVAAAEPKSGKKKQDRNKKELLNGPSLSAEGKTSGHKNDELSVSPGKDSVLIGSVVVPNRSPQGAMGNSSGRGTGNDADSNLSTSTTRESLDKGGSNNSSDFHDCPDSLPESSSSSSQDITSKEMTEVKTAGNRKPTELSVNSMMGDSSKLVHVNNNKKLSKASRVPGRREKSEPPSDSEPLSPRLTAVKPRELSEPQDGVVKSVCVETTYSVDYNDTLDGQLEPGVKREESFTEVKKKKKRSNMKEINHIPGNNNFTNNFPSHNNSFSPTYQPRGGGAPYRGTQRPRATTPPPVSVSSLSTTTTTSSLPVDKGSPMASRDLSPSSFPVLSGHSPPGPRADGRRNSCGDISTESMDNKVLYDSDRESVKSLPAAHGAKPASVETYSAYPVSYARMAAAPKRIGETAISPSSESGVASGSQNSSSLSSSAAHTPGSSIDINSPPSPSNPVVTTPERKTTVWKGSPRERRHSIGSSPEDLAECDKSSMSQRNRQKSGSQEVLTREGLAAPTAVLPSPPVKNIQAAEADLSAVEVADSKPTPAQARSQAAVPVTSVSKPAPASSTPVPQAAVNPLGKPVPSNTPLSVSSYATVTSTNPQISGPPSGPPSQPPSAQSAVAAHSAAGKTPSLLPGEKLELEPNSLLVSIPTPNQSKSVLEEEGSEVHTDNSTSKLQSAPAMATGEKCVEPQSRKPVGPSTNNNTSASRSVIFLDKRFDAAPRQNLGITFGFDSTFESSPAPPPSSDAGPVTSQAVSSAAQQSQPSTSPATATNEQFPLPATLSSLLPSSSQLPSAKQPGPHAPQGPHASQVPAPHIPAQPSVATPTSFSRSQSSSSSSPQCPPQHSDTSNCGSKVPKAPHIAGPSNGLILPSPPAVANSSKPQASLVSASSNGDNKTSYGGSISGVKNSAGPGSATSRTNSKPVSVPVIPALAGSSMSSSTPSPAVPLAPTQPAMVARPPPPAGLISAGGVVFSPNHPPPPLPGQMGLHGGSNHQASAAISTSSLSSSKAGEPSANKVGPATKTNNNRKGSGSSLGPAPTTTPSSSSPYLTTGAGDSGGATALVNMMVSAPPQGPQPTAVTGHGPQLPTPEMLNTAIPVIYGMKINPNGGCGVVMYRPPEQIDAKKGKNNNEASGFLKKKWCEIREPTSKNAPVFVTVSED